MRSPPVNWRFRFCLWDRLFLRFSEHLADASHAISKFVTTLHGFYKEVSVTNWLASHSVPNFGYTIANDGQEHQVSPQVADFTTDVNAQGEEGGKRT